MARLVLTILGVVFLTPLGYGLLNLGRSVAAPVALILTAFVLTPLLGAAALALAFLARPQAQARGARGRALGGQFSAD
jgi:hypothetical protein